MGDKQEMMSANVQVAVRCRPLNSREKTAGNLHVVTTEPGHHRVRIAHKKLDRTYQYDHVFGPFASQEEVFVSTVQPIVREMLQGYSTTVFAYGQTGTGKTHTMEGDITDADNMGVIPRSVHAIFDYLDRISADYTVRTSFLELYNEELQDLLGDSGANKNKVVLREDAKRGVVCCGLEEVQVLSAKDIFSILSRGIQQRKTAETLMNKNSSRSHSIFTLKIMIKECMPDGQEVMRNGQLNLVDLAGSECVGRSGAKNARAREAGNINQSLLTLGRVITALVEHHPHVPYRDSKLTRLLQESLGGRAKTCIIATVTPSSDALEETISSLDYALKAKSIQNKPVANQRLSKTHLLKEYAGELESLRSMLQASRDKNGVYMEPWRFDHMESTLASQANQIAEMEEILAMRNNETKELKADRDRFQEQATELAGELEVSKGKEESLTGELSGTRRRLECVEGELSSSRAEATELRGKLEVTRKTLKDTEWKLGATRAVVTEQSSTETRLTTEAEQTKRSLELAEEDVGGLRAKIARQEDESATKRAKAERFQESASKAATGVSDAVARFTGEHAKGCASLRETVAAAERRARDAASKLSSAAVSAMDQANRHCKEMAAGVTQGSETAEECLRAASASLEQALLTQGGALKEWETQMEASLGELRRGLRDQEGSLASLSEDVKRRSEEAHREMTAFRDKCAADLASIKSWAEERVASQARQMELNKKEALDIAASAKELARLESEEFVKSLTALVKEMQSKATARADKLASTSESTWTGSVAAATTFSTQMSDRVNASASHVSSGVQGMLDSFERSTSVTRDAFQASESPLPSSRDMGSARTDGGNSVRSILIQHTNMNNIATCQPRPFFFALSLPLRAPSTSPEEHAKTASSFAASTMDVSENVTAGAARLSGLTEAATTGVKRDLDRVSASVAETAAKCRRGAETLADDATGAVASFNALREEAEADVHKCGAEATLQVDALGSAVTGFRGEHEGSLGACMEHIQDHVKEACDSRAPSGGTPERKVYPRPDGFSVTRSHGEIMSDYGAASRVNSPPPPPPSPNGSTATSTVTGAAARLSEEGGEGSPVEMEVDGNGGEGREGTEGHENMKDEMMGEQRRCRSVSVGESTRAEEGCGAASARSSFGAETTCSEDAMSVQDGGEAAGGGTMVPLCEATNITKGRAETADDASSTDGAGGVEGRGGSKIPTFRRSTRRARAA